MDETRGKPRATRRIRSCGAPSARFVRYIPAMEFTISYTDGLARSGRIETDHGSLSTPAFMPVGTAGSVKGIESAELAACGAEIVLANAYHLYLRPGADTIRALGGLHRFIAWDGPILVDSGGYQVLSLAQLRRVDEDGVTFRSHLDGSEHRFTPETVIAIQRALGADFVMPLDELVGWPASREQAGAAAERTWRWLKRALEAFDKSDCLYDHEQTLIPIVQGSFYEELRRKETERYASLDAPVYAIGGLAVGEESERTRKAIELVAGALPEERPRYAMGVGTPDDLLAAVGLGVDLFDCVVPTRNGRRATLYTFSGRMNLRNARWARDPRPVEEGCPCPLCRRHSRAYLRHLFVSGELLAMKLASAHNLVFYFKLLAEARARIRERTYHSWAAEIGARAMSPIRD
ncbi:MAG: Queuine tRNA-ribosyltransferase [Calditrichaeota bacterium]|nr:Queuine tRNA-ribosyltransferase [Calditrichota bacterium]